VIVTGTKNVGWWAEVRRVFYRYAIFYCLAGLLSLEALASILQLPEEPSGPGARWLVLLAVAVVNGMVVGAGGAVVAGIGRRRGQRLRPAAAAAAVGWAGGAVVVPYYVWWQTVLVVALGVAALVVEHVRSFLRTLRRILSPQVYPTWTDVARLAHIYLTVLAAVTLINTSIALLHDSVPGWGPAYDYSGGEARSVLDAFYFSVVVMTTLGFGDIRPVSLDAKLVVSLECLVSYVMLALMIGCITRGVVRSAERTDDG